MSEIDPALLAALAGLLEEKDSEQPEEEQAQEEEAIPEPEESLYEQLGKLEELVN